MSEKNESRIKKWLGIIGGVIAILGFLFELLTGGTLLNLIKFRSHEIGDISSNSSFAITSIKDSLGRNLESGDRFSYQFGVPLTLHGIMPSKLDVDESIWVILIDNYGKYFPQYPTLQIYNGNQWKSTNIRPLNGITDIIFVKVDKSGSDELKKFIDNNSYQTSKLPQSAEELGRVILR